MNPPTPGAIAAAVLAGGRSSRMGCDKAFLPLRGRRLLDHQLDTLRALGPTELLISGRAGVDYAVADARVVVDATPDQGPLAGLLAVLEATSASRVVVLAVDLPAMTPTFLAGLYAETAPGIGCVPQIAGRWEPLAAVYPRTMLPRVQAHLARGERALYRVIAAAVAAGELRSRLVGDAEVPLFANWNTPADCAE